MWSLKTFKAHCKMQINPIRMILYEKCGKRYLVVIRTSFIKPKWIRRFEIVTELNPVSLEPIGFNGRKIDDCKIQPSNDNVMP